MHLSKVPSGQDVGAYDGSGEWVKIYRMGLEYRPQEPKPVYWIAYNDEMQPPRVILTQVHPTLKSNDPQIFAKIPSQTPPGQYLLRIDLIYEGMTYDGADFKSHADAQLYPSCLQIEVASNATGTLPKGVKIPEVFSPQSPGMSLI